MAISTKPGGKYDTENGQYVSDGSISAELNDENQTQPTREKQLSKVLKGEANRKKYGYTKKEYNDFGWARANEILSAGQNEDYRSKFMMLKTNQASFQVSADGEYMIPVGEKYGENEGANNVIVYAKGTIKNPVISRVLTIKEIKDETTLSLLREHIYEVERYGDKVQASVLFEINNRDDF